MNFQYLKITIYEIAHLLIFGLLLVMSCSSPEKLLQKGNYDALIEKSVKNLIKKPDSEEDANMLDKAYKLANDRDLERIKYLKMEGNPNTWDEMLGLIQQFEEPAGFRAEGASPSCGWSYNSV